MFALRDEYNNNNNKIDWNRYFDFSTPGIDCTTNVRLNGLASKNSFRGIFRDAEPIYGARVRVVCTGFAALCGASEYGGARASRAIDAGADDHDHHDIGIGRCYRVHNGQRR